LTIVRCVFFQTESVALVSMMTVLGMSVTHYALLLLPAIIVVEFLMVLGISLGLAELVLHRLMRNTGDTASINLLSLKGDLVYLEEGNR